MKANNVAFRAHGQERWGAVQCVDLRFMIKGLEGHRELFFARNRELPGKREGLPAVMLQLQLKTITGGTWPEGSMLGVDPPGS